MCYLSLLNSSYENELTNLHKQIIKYNVKLSVTASNITLQQHCKTLKAIAHYHNLLLCALIYIAALSSVLLATANLI
jgi:hypothetical protein